MTYSKPWLPESEIATDPWLQWLQSRELTSRDYNLLFWEDRVEITFASSKLAEEFAREQGL